MTKKTKIILGLSSLAPVVAITVLASVISLRVNTTNNTTAVNNNAAALSKINVTANPNTTITATDAAQLLSSNSTNLDPLSNYFDTQLIVSTATNNGIKATYSAAPVANNASDVLIITVTMTSDTVTTTQTINVSGFLSIDQITVNNYISSINALPVNTITGISTQAIPPAITNGNYTTYLSGIPTPASGISLSFTLIDPNTVSGTVNIVITASIGSTSKAANTIVVSGFLSTAQITIDNYIASINALSAGTITGVKVLPSSLTVNNIAASLNNVPPIPDGLSLSYTITSPDDTNGTISLTITALILNSTTTTLKTSNPIVVSGFLTTADYLSYSIGVIALQANSHMPPPTNTTALTLQNAEAILITFGITASQIAALGQIQDLLISVTNSSITTGTATLGFSATVNGTTVTYSQTYSGFFIGNSTAIQTNLQTYFATATNSASFLQNYLALNQSFLTNLVINTDTGNAYWGYSVTSPNSNTNNFNNIAVVYDATTQTYNLTATTTNTININGYNGSNFVLSGVIPTGTQVTITLPFLFSGTLANYSPLNIAISPTGSVALSWNAAQFTSYQGTIGIQTSFIPNNSSTPSSILLPWRTPVIATIIF